jgi:tetratricopeptide (TPR) repeat protein
VRCLPAAHHSAHCSILCGAAALILGPRRIFGHVDRIPSALAETGNFDEALARANEALHIGEETDHPYGTFHGYAAIGAVHAERGEFDMAIASLERGLAIATQANVPAMTAPSVYHLAHAYSLAGRIQEATSLLEDNVIWAREKHWNAFLSLGVLHLGEAYVLAGRRGEATRTAAEALALSTEFRQRGYEARARLLLGETADWRVPGEVDRVEAEIRRAIRGTETGRDRDRFFGDGQGSH